MSLFSPLASAQDTEHKKPPGETCADKAARNKGSSSAAQKTEAKPGAAGPKKVLDPSGFFGKAAAGYAAAKQIPEICAKLFCYCGCDLTDLHNNLLDCFVCQHGVDCDICQDEAIHALRMNKAGKSVAEIQKFIDTQFENQYPFSEPSATLKKYRATRLYKTQRASAATPPAVGSQINHKTNQMISSNSPAVETGKPKLKPGFKVGACCGHSRKRG